MYRSGTSKLNRHPNQREEEYAWNGPVLEVWLDARTDADYLETRALKFVAVIEALRTIVLRNRHGPISHRERGMHSSPTSSPQLVFT